MANIGRQPTAIELLNQPDVRGSYGERLFFEKEGEDEIKLVTPDNTVVALATKRDAAVNLDRVDAFLAPYINAFLAHSNRRIEKYWRTREYRILTVNKTKPATSVGVLNEAPRIPIEGAEIVFNSEFLRGFALILNQAADAIDEANQR